LKSEENPGRKTKYDLIAVKANEFIFTNSKYHSQIMENLLRKGIPFKPKEIKKEVKVGESRIDFLVDGVPLEVKGCTLVRNFIALFPDAPTVKGLRHLKEIIFHRGILVFLIFRKAKCFAPNKLDGKFYETFIANYRKIKIYPLQLSYDGIWVKFSKQILLCQTF
jgi:sugar fermentation stimulation protein A